MATDLKRFTISVTPSMETDLDIIKRKLYYNKTQNDMIRDLISIGLTSLKSKPDSTLILDNDDRY